MCLWIRSTLGRHESLRRFSVSILEGGGRLSVKCLLLSYFRVGDNPPGTRTNGSSMSPVRNS